MSIDYKLIGKRVQAKRKEHKITQEEMAERLSVTVGYVSQIERGITKVNLGTLSNISDILDTDISFFVTGTSPAQESYLNNDFYDKYQRLSPTQKQIVEEMTDVLLKHKI